MLGYIIGGAAAVFAFLYSQNNIFSKTKYTINSDVSASFRIVHLSDLHSKTFGNRLVKAVAKEKPHLIAVTGDLIDDDRKDPQKMIALMGKLTKIAPVFYCVGNHDHRFAEMEENFEGLRTNGVTVLQNKITRFNANGEIITILGLDENQASKENYKQRKNGEFTYKDNRLYFDELKKHGGFKLVLSHYPENFAAIGEKSYNRFDFDLMLAGHAHGGQFRFPIIGGLYAPGQGLFPKYCSGEYGDRPKLIVSRGLGNSNFPFRLFNLPQIISITVKPK